MQLLSEIRVNTSFDLFIIVAIALFVVAAVVLRRANVGYSIAMAGFAVFAAAFLVAGP